MTCDLLRHWSLRALLLLASSALAVADEEEDAKREEAEQAPAMSDHTFSGLAWRGIGPALMSGRVADIAVDPRDQSTWYVAVGSGNVWKTTNAGTTWSTIFDDQPSYSIGCITLDPQNPDIVWVGTGENVGGRHVGYGDGIYVSRNAGKSWTNVGLTASEHIGNIVVHPHDSDTVFVAAQGPLWSPGGDRGVFKTTDGGKSWRKVLGGGEYTGANEVRMDPTNPDILYAATHQRFRNVAALINGGPESGIHKSTDGGETWRELKKGLPSGDMGKIGLAVSPQQPNVVYAAIELAQRTGGFWRSDDYGESWQQQSDQISGGTGPHYYQEIFACPHVFDRVYFMSVRMSVTHDGGENFEPVIERHKHVDNHALVFDPKDPNYLLSGSDGGLYETWDLGKNWKYVANLPVTQFYKVAVDYDEPFYNVIGGTQDNNTQYGPSRTDNVHGIRNSDWMITLFGDGHQPAIDPTNPDIIYSQWQQGNLVRHDRRTSEITHIKPQPQAGELPDRFNWDAPILISPHDPARLYFAGNRLWRSDNRGDSWTPVSPDLTRDIDRLREPMMGRVWGFEAAWDLRAMSQFSTIANISESPLVEGLLYVGTDDGLVQVSEDGGDNWRKIESLPGVPDGFFVNDIKADLHDADTAYVCVDNHKAGDFKPYVLKTTNRGRTWTSITGDLPDRHLVWRLVQDHARPELLFVGTEFGVFLTLDGGNQWIKLKGKVPTIPFRDLVIQQRENDLVGATFGRGFYILDDYSPLREITADELEKPALLFPVKDAHWYHVRPILSGSPKASQGAAFYTAPNPPFGATFTYYLKQSLKTSRDQRQDAEKKLAEAGADTPMPSWEELRREELEEQPEIVFTIRDDAGALVRRITAPARKGIQRATWSLTYPTTSAWTDRPERDEDEDEPRRDPDDGELVAPGRYTVSMSQRVDGQETDLGLTQSFNVVPLHEGGTLPGTTPQQRTQFRLQLAEVQRALSGLQSVLTDAQTRLKAMRQIVDRTPIEDVELPAKIRALEDVVNAIDLKLNGYRPQNLMNEQSPYPISARYWRVNSGTGSSLSSPTPMWREQFAILKQEVGEAGSTLNEVMTQKIPQLEQQLEAAGAPWTPGRPVPNR